MAIAEETRSRRGLQIAGGIMTIAGIGISIGLYLVFLIYLFGIGILALLFGQPEAIMLIIVIIGNIAVSVIGIIGGVLGLAKVSKTGAILSIIGSALLFVLNMFMYLSRETFAGFLGGKFYSVPLIIIFTSIVAVVGALILLISISGSSGSA